MSGKDNEDLMKLTKLEQVCTACPSAWEGETEHGGFIYIRYRHGHLSVSIALSNEDWFNNNTKILEKVVGDALDGFMSTEEMLEHAGLEFDGKLPPPIEMPTEDDFIDFLEGFDKKRYNEEGS